MSLIDDAAKLVQAANTLNQLNGGKGKNGLNNMDATYADVLNRLLSGSDNSYLQALLSAGFNQRDGLTGDQRDDLNKQLLDAALNYQSTAENRQYNEKLRDEQRSYDLPINQISRLVGAGISRNAAIQMLLGGSAGSGVGSAPYSQPAYVPQGIAPSQSALNGEQRTYTQEREILDPIDTAINMVSVGLGAASAIQGAKMMQNQAILSYDSLLGFQAANEVMDSLGNAVTSGAIDQETLNSFTNANDVFKYLQDHQDTSAFKPIFDSGAFNRVYGTKNGRAFFNDIWHDVTDSKNYGQIASQFIDRENLHNELLSINSKQAQRDYYLSLSTTLNDLLKSDFEVANLWNLYQSGQIEVLIDGERLEQEKSLTAISRLSQTHAERVSYTEGVEFDAFKNFVEKGEPIEPGENSTGFDIITYNVWADWYKRLQMNLLSTSNSAYSRSWAPDGSAYTDTSFRSAYKDFLRKNTRFAYNAAFVNDLVMSGRLESWQGDKRPIWQFFDMCKSSGLYDFMSTTGQVAAEVAVPFLKPAKGATFVINK